MAEDRSPPKGSSAAAPKPASLRQTLLQGSAMPRQAAPVR
jgi:hypothetical protein